MWRRGQPSSFLKTVRNHQKVEMKKALTARNRRLPYSAANVAKAAESRIRGLSQLHFNLAVVKIQSLSERILAIGACKKLISLVLVSKRREELLPEKGKRQKTPLATVARKRDASSKQNPRTSSREA